MSTSNNSNQQTLADSGANERPPMLKRGNYIPWESRFRKFLDNKLEERERIWNSIQNGPYVRPTIPNPNGVENINGTVIQILEPLSKMTEGNKKQYIADVKERIKRLMFGSDVTSHIRHSRLMDEFDKFPAKGETLESVYERLTMLVNIMDRNNVRPISVSINTKFLNCLQPEWSKYVTMVRHNQTGETVSYDMLGVTRDSQDDKLTTAMMLLARAITQKFSTPTNNSLRTSSNTRNQTVIPDGRVDIQTKNAGYGGNGKTNVQCYNCNEKGHYARDFQKPRVRDAKYFREQMLLAMKDKAGSNLNNEENDFMLTLHMTMPSYDAKAVSEVNASSKVHEQMHHAKRKTIIQTSDDDQIDSNIIFDDPYVENNGGTSDHDSNDHDEYHKIQMLAYDVQREAENKKRLNNELKKQKMLLQKELETSKKAFKERENRYLEDIVNLEEKLSSHDRIVYEMGQSIQTIHMLGKIPNKVYDPSLKSRLGHKNPERLKKAIAAQPKMYDGEKLHSVNLKIDSPDSEETLEDAEESRLKMRNKMVQIIYGNLNAFYETFVPQQDFSMEHTYFSIPSTSTNGSESKAVTSDLPILKIPKESKLLKMFDTLGMEINGLRTRIDITLLEDRQRRWMSDSQNCLREFYKTDVILMSASLSKNLKEHKEELIVEVQEMLNIFESMEQKVDGKSSKENILQNEIDRLLEVSLRSEIRDCKISRSVSIDSNKCETKDSNVCQTNASVSNSKTVNVVNDGSNIVCVSCGKDVFLLSHEKCVARYALSRNSNVKRAIFTTLVATKSKNWRATSVVAKSRLSVADTLKATNKVFSATSLSNDSSQSKTLSNYMKNKIAISQKWQRWFKYQQSFNWSPKSKTAQSLPSETNSRIRVRSTSNTPVTTQKWVAKLSTLPSAFVSCYADLEVAFRSNTCYVQNLEGDDLLTGSRDSNLYTISISEMATSSSVCLMSKATSTKSWLWHRRLSHLNFGTINQLTSKDLVDGLLKFKYNKDHLCSACEQGKSKKASLPPKLVPSTESKLKLLHMDLCGPMRVLSINGKKYILVIVDDYSWYTWVYFLRTKYEALDMIIDFVNQVQRNIKAQILTIRTDNGTKFKNEKLRAFYAKLGIVHQTSIARTPQQNGVVERQNRTLVEAARTMLIFSKAPEFLLAEAIATACFTQNCSIVHTRYNNSL
ncbi:retrovirus-related pol polyprotein from transposon TNT 1-94 [Tanacetum coccineum]